MSPSSCKNTWFSKQLYGHGYISHQFETLGQQFLDCQILSSVTLQLLKSLHALKAMNTLSIQEAQETYSRFGEKQDIIIISMMDNWVFSKRIHVLPDKPISQLK